MAIKFRYGYSERYTKTKRPQDGENRHLTEGKDVSAEMLKAGMTWHYKQYDQSEEYAGLENRARKKRAGLWADKEPVAPWEFRR